MKDILIHVRNLEKRGPAADFGARLAAAFGAAATGLYVCPRALDIAPAFEPEVLTAAIGKVRQLVEDAVRARQSFLDWAASLGAAQADWIVAEGPVSDALAQAATRHDLLVLDHVDDDFGSAWVMPGVILATGIPCIVMPRRTFHYVNPGRVAVGWNGSPEAMRAVHAALPFLQGRQVLLLRGEERARYAGVEWNPPFDIEAYLRLRGVGVEARAITARPDDAGAALLEEAVRFRADLLVMGAYGRSRFSEWMLGGATRHVLTWADIPVLLRH